MATTNVSFEMNEKLKDQMSELCEELGMDIDDAFQLFARKMVNEQEIPFEVTEKELPMSEGEQIVRTVIKWTAITAAITAAAALIIRLVRVFKR